MVLNTSSITVHPAKRAEFFQTVAQLIDPIKRAAGCKGFHLYVDATDENSSLLVGEWESESDLDNYLHSRDCAILHGAIKVLGTRSSELKAIVN